ncbi:putative glycosyl hydrolase, five-bladed beta-propellor domain-containing protein [Rosa chinensis]|uniref:Putative glycosyl hydrolase, five-bladed beta-propellor domain-containing protein n=1 Tax=Rosa chinensis TaxID=74649 RepID=A0A2P6R2U0_ROSCH|nr:uncharacterized protein LOC112198269 [Rosa chinensis]PRQ40741.1 putative glycosyl hydrolase, five-bladed beta-propellor domain-containing protein [Rosa chinensis]
MDTASATAMKALNLLATPTKQRATASTNLTSQTPPTKPNSHTLHLQSSNPRTRAIFLTRCSTKPDTYTDNQEDQNSTVEPNLNSKPLNPSPLTSVDPLSSPISSFPSSSTKGLVFDLGVENSWDGAGVGSPVVKRFLGDEEERWYMWYNGRSNSNPGSDSIGLAISSNGVHWNRGRGAVQSSQDVGLVMSSGKDWWAFDTLSIRPSEVVVMSSSKVRASSAVYWLYYTGYSPEKVEISEVPIGLENPEQSGQVFKSLLGLAISQDGRHWARIEGEHHSGALFDVGMEKDWDSSFIAGSHVVFHERGDLRMYYHSFDLENGHYGIGIARSRDGMKWVKLGKIIGGGRSGGFDELGAMNPCVVRKRGSGEYLMAYEGVVGNGGRSIGLAVSRDGLKDWTRCGDEAVLKSSEKSGWDSNGVGSPCLVQMDGEEDEWRLYYRGVGIGGRTGIGMAVSEGSDYRSFRRWAGFHL